MHDYPDKAGSGGLVEGEPVAANPEAGGARYALPGVMRALLAEVGLPTLPIQGAYFLLAEFDRLGRFTDDVAFCRHLTTAVGVAAIPPSAFYADPKAAPRLARFCFAKSDATLDAAATRLRRLVPG